MYTMTIDLPNLAKGADVEIDGLGLFQNGDTVTVDKDLAETFRQRHQTVESETDQSGNTQRTIVRGPTLLQYFSKHDHIVVTTDKQDESDEDNKGDEN